MFPLFQATTDICLRDAPRESSGVSHGCGSDGHSGPAGISCAMMVQENSVADVLSRIKIEKNHYSEVQKKTIATLFI